ncbi:alpha/beta hydrolase [Mycobacterium sp. URHB0044]|uniref:alpha/beta hydrolase n=1 Tax=Mycobacterium sp. URHB0044 TaxID=1380386 RepID=UPI0004913D16|nr:alpha/beta hydrolase [Mycobacterium sp. URHB0044]
MSLDPQIADLIDALDAGFPRVHTMSGALARATIRSRYVSPAQPEVVDEVRDIAIPGVGGDLNVRIYRPAGSSGGALPILVYAHGGGFVFCDLDSHDGLCRNLANRLGAVVLSVAYRLAPESTWPAAANDLYAAVQWAAANADALGGDPTRIAAGGDSAGGNLAAVTSLMARDRNGPSIAAQLLLYPVISADFTTDSYRLFGKGFYNPIEAMRWYWDQYVPTVADRDHPYANPLNATLDGLPPAVIVIAGHDPLRDDGSLYADALESAGVPVTRCHYEGGIHGFMTMPMFDIAHRARAEACGALARMLGRTLR